MPRRKITLDDARAVFEKHGLQVHTTPLQDPAESLAAFLEPQPKPQPGSARQVSYRRVEVTLYAAHSISAGGFVVETDEGKQVVENNVQTYGPGKVTVPAPLAQHLLHADMLARRADDRLHDRVFRSYALVPQHQGQNVGVCVSEDGNFDISSFMSAMADHNFRGIIHR